MAQTQKQEQQSPLTGDMPLWAGYRAQRAVARALADDQDADHLTLDQCEAMRGLVRKSPDCVPAALIKHLELAGIPAGQNRYRALMLANSFRSTLRFVEVAMALEEEDARPVAEASAPKIPKQDRALQLVDEPLALSDTAKGR